MYKMQFTIIHHFITYSLLSFYYTNAFPLKKFAQLKL